MTKNEQKNVIYNELLDMAVSCREIPSLRKDYYRDYMQTVYIAYSLGLMTWELRLHLENLMMNYAELGAEKEYLKLVNTLERLVMKGCE